MPHTIDFISKILEFVRRAMSVFLVVVLYSILQYIFDMHFVCSCQPGLHPNGILYLVCPSLMLTFIVNIVEPFYRKKTSSNNRCCSRNCCGHYVIKFFFRYIALTAIWITQVMFDGDWYFCLKTNFNINQTGIPCRTNLTYEEQQIKDHYKTQSLDIGFGLSCPVLFIWSIFEIRKANWKRCCPPYYRVVYEDLLDEEVTKNLNEKLQEIAKARAKEICELSIKAIENDAENYENDNLYKVWEKISDSKFFLTKDVRVTVLNTHV